MPGPVKTFLASTAVTAIAVGAGVAVAGPHDAQSDVEPPHPAVAASTPLAEFDTRFTTLERAAFCDDVPLEAVARALDAEPTTSGSYGNGDTTQITEQVRDIAHEFSCEWSADDATAQAWLFAPPVTREQADGLLAEARDGAGCRPLTDAAAFGSPSVALVCRAGDQGREVSFRGLFGDTWAACSITSQGPLGQLVDRTGQWCVAVAQSATASGAAS